VRQSPGLRRWRFEPWSAQRAARCQAPAPSAAPASASGHDGRRCKPGICRLPDDKNEPTDYASYVEVIDKARDLMAPILGREVSEHLIETVFAIETIADIRQLRPLLQRG
jgi:hypothetical protein